MRSGRRGEGTYNSIVLRVSILLLDQDGLEARSRDAALALTDNGGRVAGEDGGLGARVNVLVSPERCAELTDLDAVACEGGRRERGSAKFRNWSRGVLAAYC